MGPMRLFLHGALVLLSAACNDSETSIASLAEQLMQIMLQAPVRQKDPTWKSPPEWLRRKIQALGALQKLYKFLQTNILPPSPLYKCCTNL